MAKFRNPIPATICRNNTKIFIVEDHHFEDGDISVNLNIGIKVRRAWTYCSRSGIVIGSRAVQESPPIHLNQGLEKGINKVTTISWNLQVMLALIEQRATLRRTVFLSGSTGFWSLVLRLTILKLAVRACPICNVSFIAVIWFCIPSVRWSMSWTRSLIPLTRSLIPLTRLLIPSKRLLRASSRLLIWFRVWAMLFGEYWTEASRHIMYELID